MAGPAESNNGMVPELDGSDLIKAASARRPEVDYGKRFHGEFQRERRAFKAGFLLCVGFRLIPCLAVLVAGQSFSTTKKNCILADV